MSLFHTRTSLLLISLIAAQAAMAHNAPSTGATAALLSASQKATPPDTTAPADDGLTGVDHFPGTSPVPLPKPRAR